MDNLTKHGTMHRIAPVETQLRSVSHEGSTLSTPMTAHNYWACMWDEGLEVDAALYYVYVMVHLPSGHLYVGSRGGHIEEGVEPMLDDYGGSPSAGNLFWALTRAHPAEEFVKAIVGTFDDRQEAMDCEQRMIKAAYKAFGKACNGGLVCNLRSGDQPPQGPSKEPTVSLLTPEQLDRWYI